MRHTKSKPHTIVFLLPKITWNQSNFAFEFDGKPNHIHRVAFLCSQQKKIAIENTNVYYTMFVDVKIFRQFQQKLCKNFKGLFVG